MFSVPVMKIKIIPILLIHRIGYMIWEGEGYRKMWGGGERETEGVKTDS